MLILARKAGQCIVIGGQIEITIIEVRGEQVRLGITAPRDIEVYRKELLADGNGRAGKQLGAAEAVAE